MLCQRLSPTGCPSCWPAGHAPHAFDRLHTSQAIEQPVQALALPCLVSRRLSDQRLAHQAYDEAVALDGAHALLQLEQDLVLVFDVAALRLRVGKRGP